MLITDRLTTLPWAVTDKLGACFHVRDVVKREMACKLITMSNKNDTDMHYL